MMKSFLSLRKILISGLAAGLLSFIAGSILYMNPLTAGVYGNNANWQCSKPMESFGGLGVWLALMLLGGLVSTVFMAVLYAYTEKALPGGPWIKGLFFGVLLWLVSKVPASYYTWLMYTYPNMLNLIETFNGLVGSIVAGVTLAVLYEKLS